MKRFIAILLFLAAASASADEYRAYWVDTFRTPFASGTDVTRIIDAAVESNANALFVQVRRRGDAWYLDAAEPLAETLDGTFDPLRALLDGAHARGIQVHAFVIVGAIFRGDPAVDPLPRDPHHVFLQHFWDAKTHRPFRGSRQWGTRTSKGRYRFGSDWYVDLGHPEAAAYTAGVLLHLVRAYDIDGLHLDRVRYPETPHGDVGYNETSVARFQARYGRRPRAHDPLWNDWRREQVTNFVRRLSLGAKAIRPSITISAALIAWGSRSRRETAALQARTPIASHFRIGRRGCAKGSSIWAVRCFTNASTRRRSGSNSTTGCSSSSPPRTPTAARQCPASARISIPSRGRCARPAARAANADGIIFFAMGDTKPWSILANSTNDAVKGNPYALPVAGVFTPKRPNEEFFAALRTSTATDGRTAFERMAQPLFAAVSPPPRRADDPNGAVMGYAPGDGTLVTIESPASHITRTTHTDGNGFFGMLGLPPGEYRVVAGAMSISFNVTAGTVTTVSSPP